ncbi:MAG TPA: TSUP family transporter [Candidatus Corynebacterium gallistercoris]|uniref:Probable membrane transporter protein n=1 Tax=Candidatus Corynebacterium gallistercoris TaxID=2838530 RepID=A0A9D1UQL0_9CORY|nr:TSUP family transporter [Candidatus Corynebacterium gallistercoris]
MLADIGAEVLALLLAGSALAGFVDAVVGGGGLILIPLVMMGLPGFTAVQAVAMNKVAAVSGTSSAAVRLLRTVPVDRKLLYSTAPLALVCSAAGAVTATAMSSDVMRPLVIVLLVAVGVYVAAKPSFGQVTRSHTASPSPARWVLAVVAVGAIALYDGFFGPGTGTFLIMVLTALLSRTFIESVTMAKVINTATNVGALVVFAVGGHVDWALGLVLAVANIAGAQVGARMVITKGTGFVRIMLLVVVVAMAAKLTADMLLAG